MKPDAEKILTTLYSLWFHQNGMKLERIEVSHENNNNSTALVRPDKTCEKV